MNIAFTLEDNELVVTINEHVYREMIAALDTQRSVSFSGFDNVVGEDCIISFKVVD